MGRRSRRTSRARSTPPTRRSTRPPASPPASQMQRPETATTVRVQDGKTLTTDGPFVEIKEAIGGYLLLRGRRPRRRDRAGRADPGGAHGRRDRGAPDRGVVAILEQAFRDQWGRVLAALIGFLGDFDLAEEAAQEAFAIAAERWPRDGVPANPGAWLVTTARNRAIDRIRRDRTLAAKTRLLEVPEAAEDTMDDDDIPRRAARARLHLLPSGARHRGAGRAHAAHARRPDHRRDRPRLPGPRADDGAAAGAGEAQDQGGRDPVPGAARPPAARSARRRARGRLPDLQRGLRRPRRPGGRGAAARAGARRADARRAGGARPAGDDAAARRPPRGALPRRRAGAARRPGPLALGRGADRRRAGGARPGAGAARPRSVRRAGGDRVPARRRAARLAADRRPLRRARPPHRLAGRRAEPGRRGRRGARAPRRGSRSSTASRSRTTATCTRRAASCCAASVAPTRPATPTAARWRWSTTTPSGACSSGGWRSSAPA